MRLLVLCTVTLATTVSFAVNAADLGYPAPLPQYGVAPPPAAPPTQVIIVPGPPASPHYDYGASAAPPVIEPYPNEAYHPVPPAPVGSPVAVVPSQACPPRWICVERGCGWQPTCVPRPEPYSDGYGAPGPRVYSGPRPLPAPGPYSGPYGPPVDAPYVGEPGVYRP